ncbi:MULTISPECIES: DUF1249 domain-containing protein [unclassified Shewanella]|uniref:DUF1249 domain-containing protein n=1 Tax=unclassified Shewanella TaxID=196818 RepID=UPI000C8268A2|nr:MULTISPECIES: DUF1249 domain-containing protein [unclassified Shewanella]MDO6641424.1 DUF1249 domain-containing protein [Shewanella sp. 5_MG-2023]MDO6776659.1 DUF1249 domain-containing protein [Shewanella sp. 3_MG-2023]PMG30669.1 hypothetical protein BCU94_01865 [Shewanella sp. 10N.286.52.C2]PMG41590.1 hypothetical protein BCU91_10075 [Shewanella sp. 10N.286.52.B9]PMH85404.1 hypothetical protein BCU57_14670 [Shewanella sp. 10N.286.48.B5]
MSQQVTKNKYQPNVSAFLALCGRNYALILKWLPEDGEINEPWTVKGQFGLLDITIIENTKYTQLIEIKRHFPLGDFLTTPKACVRVYHDAQLAEVLTSQQIYRLKAVYDYPNVHMHQTDEKYQVNAFLEELLKIGCRPQHLCST